MIDKALMISDLKIEARIVELSLQHPEYRPVLLFRLLKRDGINIQFPLISQVLKRHGLENRDKRIARSKVKRAVVEFIAQQEKASNVNLVHTNKIPPPHVLAAKNIPSKKRFNYSWGLTAFNSLLIIMLACSAFYALQKTKNAFKEPQAVSEPSLVAHSLPTVSAENFTLRLKDYRIIWERNLFDISENKKPPIIKKLGKKGLPLAKKDFGIKLVGTVVSDDPSLNRALIENFKARTQGIYREGNKIDYILIKRILNDRIIINAGRGDEILEMRDPLTIASRLPDEAGPIKNAVKIMPRRSGGRHRSITLSREAVKLALSDIDRTLDNVYLSKGKVFNRTTGFRITSFEPDTIFSQMGLKNYDLILSINEQKIKSPEQAKTFFDKIRKGDSLDIKVRRRARTRHIHLSIE